MRQCKLKKDRKEKLRTGGRCSFVTAWRLVTESGTDLVQPWFDSKAEARDAAKALGYEITGEV